MNKKVFIRTFGCQMNVRDSEVICGLLKNHGYKITNDAAKADVILFNTCSVRQHAEDKVWSEIGIFSKFKRQSPAGAVPIIGLVGCMAQEHKEKIFARAPNVDFVVGPQDLHKIPEIIKSFTKIKRQSPAGAAPSMLFQTKIWETEGEIRPQEIYHTGFYENKNHAYVVISEGCSNFCSYCVVPYVRGRLRNRNYKDILKEIEEAIDKGITKITLLGQNVNAYEHDGVNFTRLISLVNLVSGLKEFSFITSHPKDTSLDLFKAMQESEKLKKYLHLPVQSGSDRILKLMNRGYTRRFYLDLVDNYRKIIKKAILTTDIIVGFPTETEADFRDTYNLVKDIEFDAAYIFKYSPRPHTEAEKLIDDIAREEKERRHSLILQLQKEISNKVKSQKSKVKSSIQNLKFLILTCTFAFFILHFAFVSKSYALNLDKVKVNFISGDYQSAILEGEKILANAQQIKNLDELYYILGLSYLKEGNYLRASDIFEIILKEFKDSYFKEDARLGIGDTYFLSGDYRQAEKYYQALLNNNPQTKLEAPLYYRLSLCAAKLGDNQRAKKYLDKIKHDFPLNLEARVDKNLRSLSDFYYTVQVGSFSNRANAKNLTQKLIQKGYPAYIEEASLPRSKIIYRVRVGKVRLRQEAQDLENKLIQEGYPTKIYP